MLPAEPSLIDVAFLLGMTIISVTSGWWLCALVNPASARAESRRELKKARDSLAAILDVAQRMSDDVGVHNAQVSRINTDLSESIEEQDGTLVTKALDELLQANERLQDRLKSAEEKLENQTRELEMKKVEALTDPLTGLPNRRALNEKLERYVRSFNEGGLPFAMIMADIDHFKPVNDQYGHDAGDAVLTSVAKIMEHELGDNAFVARYGGEEFAAVLPGADLEQASASVEKLRKAIEAAVLDIGDSSITVTISQGAAQIMTTETKDSLMRRADEALYVSKKNGRNRGSLHDGDSVIPVIVPVDPSAQEEPRGTNDADAAGPPQSSVETINLISRTRFCEEVNRHIKRWEKHPYPVAVLLARVDDMQGLCELHGETEASRVKHAVALFLQAALRKVDRLGSYDDATFAMVMPGTDVESATYIVERIEEAIRRTKLSIGSHNQVTAITVSFGFTSIREGDTTSDLLRRIEAALNDAEQEGGGRAFVHDGDTCQIVESSPAASL